MTLLTVAEVALRYRASRKTIYYWVGIERIPSLKINGLLRFSLEDLEAWEKPLKRALSLEQNHSWEALPKGRKVL